MRLYNPNLISLSSLHQLRFNGEITWISELKNLRFGTHDSQIHDQQRTTATIAYRCFHIIVHPYTNCLLHPSWTAFPLYIKAYTKLFETHCFNIFSFCERPKCAYRFPDITSSRGERIMKGQRRTTTTHRILIIFVQVKVMGIKLHSW